jgi:hypothetical protein
MKGEAVASDFPLWADQELSRKLPALREAGEGPQVEFKSEFPAQAQLGDIRVKPTQ